MMRCKEYINKLASGQLDNAPLTTRLDAFAHRMICKYCQAFYRNDQTLSRILEDYRASRVNAEDDGP